MVVKFLTACLCAESSFTELKEGPKFSKKQLRDAIEESYRQMSIQAPEEFVTDSENSEGKGALQVLEENTQSLQKLDEAFSKGTTIMALS